MYSFDVGKICVVMNIRVQRDLMPLYLENLVNGSCLIPKFQRDFIWSSKQIIDLFDSILKGFPIGSIIMWSPGEEHFPVFDKICGVDVKTESNSQCYILDGRQRLSSLVSVLLKKGENAKSFYVDMNDMTVIRSTKKDIGPELLLLSDAYDSISVVDYISRIKNDPNVTANQVARYSENAKNVNKKLLSYEIGYITVLGGRIDDAVEIFSRLNSKGADITADNMIQALTYDASSDFLFSDSITDIQQSLGRYNFSKIGRDVVLRCIFNYTDSVFFDAKSEDIIKMNDLPSIMGKVKKDLMNAVRFLHDECGLMEYKQLPYTYQIILLSMFFKYNREADMIQTIELKKWFYYTSYANYFTNTSLSNIRKDVLRFKQYCQGMNLSAMDYTVLQMPSLPQNLSLAAVRNCCFTFSTLNKRLVHDKKYVSIRYYTPTAFKNKRTLSCSIPYTTSDQNRKLKILFEKNGQYTKEYEKFFINQEIIDAYRMGKLNAFESLREKWMLRDEIKNLDGVIEVWSNDVY